MDNLLQCLKPLHLALALLGMLLTALFSIGQDITIELGLMRVTLAELCADAPPHDAALLSSLQPALTPLSAYGVTVHSPLQQLAADMLPGMMSGIGNLSGDAVGGLLGSGIGGLTGALLRGGVRLSSSPLPAILAMSLVMLAAVAWRRDQRACLWQLPACVLLPLGYAVLINATAAQAALRQQAAARGSANELTRALAPLAGLNSFSFELYPLVLYVGLYAVAAACLALFLAGRLAEQCRWGLSSMSLAELLGGWPGGGGIALRSARPLSGAAAGTGLAGDQRIRFAAVCPFCGNNRINHSRPRDCGRCRRHLGGLIERPGGQRCLACDGILLKHAAFCHHCGGWLQADEADGGC